MVHPLAEIDLLSISHAAHHAMPPTNPKDIKTRITCVQMPKASTQLARTYMLLAPLASNMCYRKLRHRQSPTVPFPCLPSVAHSRFRYGTR